MKSTDVKSSNLPPEGEVSPRVASSNPRKDNSAQSQKGKKPATAASKAEGGEALGTVGTPLKDPQILWGLFFEEAPHPYFVYDKETLAILRVNPAMVEIYGYSQAEFQEMKVSELYFEEDREVSPLPGLDGKGRREVRHRHRKGGGIQVELFEKEIEYDGRLASLVQAVNMTDKRELEARFLRTQRLECLGMLASGVAHDLNNILAPILMSASMLREELSEGAREEFLTAIEHNAQRGAKLLKQVLSFVRGVEGEAIDLRPEHLLSEVIEMIRQTFPRTIVVKTDIEPNLPEIRGEATKLYQVFLNLAVNARDAMNGDGTLEIAVRLCQLDASCTLRNAEARPGRFVAFSVKDTGCGMAPELIEKIFDPFFSTKTKDQGTGLGLSTVEGIVKAHGGIVEVESEVNVGSTFTIYLPTKEGAEEVIRSVGGHRGNGELILVVDDDIELRKLLKTILGRHGYQVVTASNGTEAMAVYVRKQGKVEVVIADLVMPQMDGVVLARAIKNLNPAAKIIASFGVRSEDRLEELASLGVTDLLRKPYQPEELLELIGRVLKGAPRN